MKRAVYPTQDEQDWQDWQRACGCIVCWDAASIHHCVGTGKQAYQNGIFVGQKFTLPLCWMHHQGPVGIHSAPRVLAEQAVIPGSTRKAVEKELLLRSLNQYREAFGRYPFTDEEIEAILQWSR